MYERGQQAGEQSKGRQPYPDCIDPYRADVGASGALATSAGQAPARYDRAGCRK